VNNFLKVKLKQYAGLTLVEMLVVLIIVGLVSTLLVQGLGNALSLYSRVQANQKQTYAQSMIHLWWRDSVSAAAPNRLNEQRFSGTPFKLDIETHGALLSGNGVITRIVWEVSESYPYSMLYRQGGQEEDERLILALESKQRPRFEYMSKSFEWHKNWPIDGKNDLPEAVRINLGSSYLHAAIRNHKDQIFFIDEVEFGRGG